MRFITTILLSLTTVNAAPNLQLKADPHFAMAPVKAKIQLRSLTHPAKSSIVLVITGDTGYQSVSVLALPDDRDGPITLPDRYYTLYEAGNYSVTADLVIEAGDAVKVVERVQLEMQVL